jgi:hypothetical protein
VAVPSAGPAPLPELRRELAAEIDDADVFKAAGAVVGVGRAVQR